MSTLAPPRSGHTRPHRTDPERRPRRGTRRLARREAGFGFLIISPAVLFVAVFTLAPMVASVALSFFSWDVITPPRFVGLDNFERIVRDDAVVSSFGTTLLLAFGIVVVQLVVGLGLAVLVNQRRRPAAKTFFRTTFYLPLLASTAAVSIFMGYMFDMKFGVINYYLNAVGLPSVPWLTSTWGAIVTIILIAAWQQVGFTFVMFVAALTSLPTDVLEAAAIDGAGPVRTLFGVKIPLISPTILFATVVAMINALQLFDQPFIMTKGGPGTATTTATIVMYQTGFQNLQFGYASAIASVLLVIILAITGLQFLAARKWAFYR